MYTDTRPKSRRWNPHPTAGQHWGGAEARHSLLLQDGTTSFQVEEARKWDSWAGKDGQVGGDSGTSAGDADVGPQTISCAHRLIVSSTGIKPLVAVIRDGAPSGGGSAPHLPSMGQRWRVPT